MHSAASSLRVRLCGVLLVCAAAMPAVSAESAKGEAARAEQAVATASTEDIERMTEHLMAMLPMDRIFKESMDQHREQLEKELNAEQRTCLERELGQDAFFARKRADVRRFAEEHPQAFVSGLKVLNDGAADLIGKIMTASLAGNDYDMDQSDPNAMVAFMGFAYATEHEKLRTLAGFDDFSGEQKGVALGAMMGRLTQVISGNCEIPQELFN